MFFHKHEYNYEQIELIEYNYKKKEDGCYQVCKSCNYSDKLIEKVLYSEESKELLNEDSFNYVLTDVDWDLNQNGEFIS